MTDLKTFQIQPVCVETIACPELAFQSQRHTLTPCNSLPPGAALSILQYMHDMCDHVHIVQGHLYLSNIQKQLTCDPLMSMTYLQSHTVCFAVHNTCKVCSCGTTSKMLFPASLDQLAAAGSMRLLIRCIYQRLMPCALPQPPLKAGLPTVWSAMCTHHAQIVCTHHMHCLHYTRMQVLMKGYDQRGFMFYTNYSSRKGQELEKNSYASLCFWWEPLHRSVSTPKFHNL